MKELKCYVCYDKCDDPGNGIICSNKHYICDECFIAQVEFQLKDENFCNFKKYGCRITCNYDTCRYKISRKILEQKMLELNKKILWDKFNKKLKEGNNDNYNNNPIVKFFVNTGTMVGKINNKMKSSFELNVEYHKNKIIEDIFNTKCPHCKKVFYDFTDCFAIKCSNCNNFLCGWCLTGFTNSNKCHDHVRKCNLSKNKGRLFSTILNFLIVRNNERANKLTTYLNKLRFYDAIEVYSELLNNLKDLNLHNVPIENDKFNIVSNVRKITDEYYEQEKNNNPVVNKVTSLTNNVMQIFRRLSAQTSIQTNVQTNLIKQNTFINDTFHFLNENKHRIIVNMIAMGFFVLLLRQIVK